MGNSWRYKFGAKLNFGAKFVSSWYVCQQVLKMCWQQTNISSMTDHVKSVSVTCVTQSLFLNSDFEKFWMCPSTISFFASDLYVLFPYPGPDWQEKRVKCIKFIVSYFTTEAYTWQRISFLDIRTLVCQILFFLLCSSTILGVPP